MRWRVFLKSVAEDGPKRIQKMISFVKIDIDLSQQRFFSKKRIKVIG
jgi:hypothetical protein